MPDETTTPYGYCECGCGQKTTLTRANCASRGWVKGEPKRFIAGHHTRLTPHDYEVRDCGHDTSCWVWARRITPNGYGEATRRTPGGSRAAHRVYWEAKNGPVPADHDLDHLCRNRCCVNPAHLEVVTRAENLRRGIGTKLDEATVREIRRLRAAGESGPSIARRFGVTHQAVYDVMRGRTWKGVE